MPRKSKVKVNQRGKYIYIYIEHKKTIGGYMYIFGKIKKDFKI